jgi:hypothetical protein
MSTMTYRFSWVLIRITFAILYFPKCFNQLARTCYILEWRKKIMFVILAVETGRLKSEIYPDSNCRN